MMLLLAMYSFVHAFCTLHLQVARVSYQWNQIAFVICAKTARFSRTQRLDVVKPASYDETDSYGIRFQNACLLLPRMVRYIVPVKARSTATPPSSVLLFSNGMLLEIASDTVVKSESVFG